MIAPSLIRRLLLGAATGLALAVAGVSMPIVAGALTPAMAQSSEDMSAALEAYGHWIRHASYGEVWIPDGVPPDWRPYEYGRWVYTDDWGWYWVSDEEEDDWGWVVYHYGRWAFDRQIGWFWVPGDEWAPAWVDWRYGDDNVGWAPLPPDDLIDTYEERPEYWSFVPLRYIAEPRLRTYFVPRDRRTFLLRETRIVNRPVHVEGRRMWVNPGLAPGFIAGRTHLEMHSYQVRPRVFGATVGVQGALTVRQEDLRTKGAVRRAAPITVQRSVTAIAPSTTVPAPQPLGKGERGHLGSHPPRAAQGGGAPQQQQQQPPSPPLQQQQQQQQKGQTGAPPRTGTPAVQQPSPAPTTAPAPGSAPAQPKVLREERRDVHPPAGAGGAPAGAGGPPPHPAGPAPQPPTARPAAPPALPPQQAPAPPVVHAPPPPPPPPPPVVHAPPPPAAAPPPPPAVRSSPPAVRGAPAPSKVPEQRRPPPKPGEKPPEPPK
ncbi:MAG TPA: DUF6600 domain-containing protein [Pseudolabrys sp.]|jgi:hypothetical protein